MIATWLLCVFFWLMTGYFLFIAWNPDYAFFSAYAGLMSAALGAAAISYFRKKDL